MVFPMLNDFFLCAHRNIVVVLVSRVVYADCVGFLSTEIVKGANQLKWVDCQFCGFGYRVNL